MAYEHKEKTPPAAHHTASDKCSLCGKHYRTGGCICPWHLPFDQWQGVALNTLKAVAGAGEPRPGS